MIKIENTKIYNNEINEMINEYNAIDRVSMYKDEDDKTIVKKCEELIEMVDMVCNAAVNMKDDCLQSEMMLALTVIGGICANVTEDFTKKLLDNNSLETLLKKLLDIVEKGE